MIPIIYGQKLLTSTIGSGEFFCPKCGSDQPYWQKTIQKKGHLYWVSLLPLGKKMEFVECRTCGEAYQPEVLSFRPGDADAFKSDFERMLLRVMVLMMTADSIIEDSEIEMLAKIYQDIASRTLTRDEIIAEAADIESASYSVVEYVSALAPVTSEEAKKLLIRIVVMVAGANDNIHDSEWQTLVEIATALGMSETQLTGVLKSLQAGAE